MQWQCFNWLDELQQCNNLSQGNRLSHKCIAIYTLKNASNITFANCQVHFYSLIFFKQYDKNMIKLTKNYRSFLFVGVSVERPVIMTSDISKWQSKITNTSLSIRVPGQGGGVNICQLKVCFTRKGLAIVPGLQFTSLSSLHLLDKQNSNINSHVVQDFY